jgi:hypothetical protein
MTRHGCPDQMNARLADQKQPGERRGLSNGRTSLRYQLYISVRYCHHDLAGRSSYIVVCELQGLRCSREHGMIAM